MPRVAVPYRAERPRTSVSLWLVLSAGAIRASSLTTWSLGFGAAALAFGSHFSVLRGSMGTLLHGRGVGLPAGRVVCPAHPTEGGLVSPLDLPCAVHGR